MKLLSERVRLVLEKNPNLEGEQGQIGLAKIAKASKSVVNQWLTGEIKSMRLDYALNIEKDLGYNHIWLVLGIGDEFAKPAVDNLNLSDQAIAVAAAFDRLPIDGKIIVLRAVGLPVKALEDEIIRKHGIG